MAVLANEQIPWLYGHDTLMQLDAGLADVIHLEQKTTEKIHKVGQAITSSGAIWDVQFVERKHHLVMLIRT
jgi:hypothetical protein